MLKKNLKRSMIYGICVLSCSVAFAPTGNCAPVKNVTSSPSATDSTPSKNVLTKEKVKEILNSSGDHTIFRVPDGITEIGYLAFYDCEDINEIILPNSVTSIGDDAFYSCTSLTKINIPDGVTSIGTYAFSDCANLTNINIPDSVVSIKYCAFEHCYKLKVVSCNKKIADEVKRLLPECYGFSITQHQKGDRVFFEYKKCIWQFFPTKQEHILSIIGRLGL